MEWEKKEVHWKLWWGPVNPWKDLSCIGPPWVSPSYGDFVNMSAKKVKRKVSEKVVLLCVKSLLLILEQWETPDANTTLALRDVFIPISIQSGIMQLFPTYISITLDDDYLHHHHSIFGRPGVTYNRIPYGHSTFHLHAMCDDSFISQILNFITSNT